MRRLDELVIMIMVSGLIILSACTPGQPQAVSISTPAVSVTTPIAGSVSPQTPVQIPSASSQGYGQVPRAAPGAYGEVYGGTRIEVYGDGSFMPPEGWPVDPATGQIAYGQFGPRVSGDAYGDSGSAFFTYSSPEGSPMQGMTPGQFFIMQDLQGLSPTAPLADMKIISSGIVDGEIAERYGSRGTQKADGVPTLSLPIMIANFPERTQSYALIMKDPDALPVAGHEWVHWLVVFYMPLMAENASIAQQSAVLQGMNDFETIGYGGPAPPDKEHNYLITVYALDIRPSLQEGFSEAELLEAIADHILDEASINGVYKP